MFASVIDFAYVNYFIEQVDIRIEFQLFSLFLDRLSIKHRIRRGPKKKTRSLWRNVRNNGVRNKQHRVS